MKTEMEKWRDEYLKDRGTTYKNHVNKFISHLRRIGKSDTPNRITLDDVHSCVGYYVKDGSLRAIASMELHLESLKSFYDYLRHTGKCRDIFSQMDYEEFKKDLTIHFQLTEKVSRETFSNETIKDILSKLDDSLEIDYFSLSTPMLQKKYFHRIVLSLFIKITLIAPTKRQIICNLKYNNLGKDFRTITVNDVTLSVPNSLRWDLKKAIELREGISKNTICKEDRILEYLIGPNFNEEDLNRWFCTFIKDYNISGIDEIEDGKDTYPVEPIMKTAISNLTKSMANLAYVSKVSGIKIGSIEKNYYNEIFNFKSKELTIGEAIDWEIRKSEYYSYI